MTKEIRLAIVAVVISLTLAIGGTAAMHAAFAPETPAYKTP